MGNTLWTMTAVAAIAAGCHKKTAGGQPAAATAGTTATTSTASGSAAGSGAGRAATPPEPLTADQLERRFASCWSDWNAGTWDDLRGCYAADAAMESPGSDPPAVTGDAAIIERMKAARAAFPDEKGATQLLLVAGHHLIGVTLVTGKQSGPLPTPGGAVAATNKGIGVYLGQVLALDDTGKVTHQWDYLDQATLLGQLQPRKDHPVRAAVDKLAMPEQIVLAANDAKEKANLATFRQVVAAFDEHDPKGLSAMLADDVVWSDQAMPKDLGKKALLAHLAEMWKGFAGLRLTVGDSWAAGDYVAAVETLEGTNDGDVASLHLEKGKKVALPLLAIHELAGNKIKATWIFSQGDSLARQLRVERPAPATEKKPTAHK